jgi:hypothetical protein
MSQEEKQRFTLASFQDGALVEQFDRAIERVCVNLADINTTNDAREIRLVVKIKPNEDRTFLEIVGGVTTKTVGQQVIRSTADLSIDTRGRAIAYNRKSKQMALPFNVTRMTESGEK